MNRYKSIFAKLAEKYTEVSQEHLQEVFEKGYRSMTSFVEGAAEERSIESLGAFNWRQILQFDSECDQTAFYYGAQAASRIEHLLTVLSEDDVDSLIRDINIDVIHNINFTPRFKEIINIANEDKITAIKDLEFDPVSVRPWLDQRNHPGVKIYFDIFGSDSFGPTYSL